MRRQPAGVMGDAGKGRRNPAWLVARAGFRPPLSARPRGGAAYSTVTDFARFRGLSMSRPSANAVW